MRKVFGVGFALLVLAACGAPKRPAATVRKVDTDAWHGVPLIELETQPFFASLPREVRKLSDGNEMWVYKSCVSWQNDTECIAGGNQYLRRARCTGGNQETRCCSHQFLVHGSEVAWWSPTGACHTDCSRRPASKPCGPDEG